MAQTQEQTLTTIPKEVIPHLIPDFILKDLRENHTEEEIDKMSVRNAFEAWLEWNGIIGYADIIHEVLFSLIISSCRGISTDQEELRNLFEMDR